MIDEREFKNNIPCVIENGIIYNIRDMQKILRDLGHVSFTEEVNGEVTSSGEGYVVSVVANNHSANIIVNKRIYLNVNGFEYMELKTIDGKTVVSLIDQFRTLNFMPLTNPLTEENISNEVIFSQEPEYDEDYDENFVEINVDDDFEDE